MDRMTLKQKHYFALFDWLEKTSFILGCLDDETISDYFKENLFSPMAESIMAETNRLFQLAREAVEDARKAA